MGKNKESNKNTKNVKKDEEEYIKLDNVGNNRDNPEQQKGIVHFVLAAIVFGLFILSLYASIEYKTDVASQSILIVLSVVFFLLFLLFTYPFKKLMDYENDAEVISTQENNTKNVYKDLKIIPDNKQEKSLSKDNVDNTIKTLDKLNMLKQVGAISDNDYDAMKKGLLSENNHKSPKHILVIVLIILGGIFFIYNLGSYSSEDEGACYTLLVKKATHRAERYSTDLIKNVTSSIERSGHCKLNYTIFKGNGLLFYNGFGGSSRPTYWCIKNKEGRYKVYIDEDRIDIDSTVLNSVGESGKNLCQAYESLINLYSFWDPWTRIVD